MAMGKKDKAKKKSQKDDAPSDIFKGVEEIYGTLIFIYKDRL